MTIRVSDWYNQFGNYTFPTVFIYLNDDEIAAILDGELSTPASRQLISKMDYVITHLPGACFVHADSCAPTDSSTFSQLDGGTKIGKTAWKMLRESDKVRSALRAEETRRIAFHPWRRMDHGREFRLFVKGGELRAISQRFLNKHHPRLEKRRDEIWVLSKNLLGEIGRLLPQEDVVLDIYLTATARLMVIDLNDWGEPTDPLLIREWNQDWSEELGVKLLPRPMRLRGDISVSF